MADPAKLAASAQFVSVLGEAIGEVASVMAALPGDGDVKIKVTEALRTTSGVVKRVPEVGFRTLDLIYRAKEAWANSAAKPLFDGMRRAGVVVNQPPPAHRQAKAGAK